MTALASFPGRLIAALRCPACGGEVARAGDTLRCSFRCRRAYVEQDGFLTFAAPGPGKYEPSYAARYAGLWAYGHETLHSGQDEPLYRVVSSLVAEALAARATTGGASAPPLIVDCGCGVGRVASDCAGLAPGGIVFGLDASLAMLELADRIGRGQGSVEVALEGYGFGRLTIAGRGRENLFLARGEVEALPIGDGVADLALSVNIVDRLPHGPERALAECFRILRPGGALVFTDPLNWTEDRWWTAYPTSAEVLDRFAATGFEVTTWFDDMMYRELLDGRGSVEEFRTLVVSARKPAG